MEKLNLKNLKKNIDNNRIYWFNFKGKKLVVDSSKNNSKKKLIKQLKNISKIDLIRLEITFHKGNKVFQGGPIKLNFKTFFYESKILKKNIISGKNGPIWIDNHWLKLNNINTKKKLNNLIDNIVKKVLKNHIIKVPGINKISLL